MPKPTRIYDLDNTLIECGSVYDARIMEGAREINAITGISVEQAVHLIETIQLIGMAQDRPFTRETFPRSLAAALTAAGLLRHGEVLPEHAQRLYDIGAAVFTDHYALYEDVLLQLELDRLNGYQLILYTKGDEEYQWRKIDRHGLSAYFDEVVVIPRKTVENLGELCGFYDVDIPNSWVIGDSRKDDIAPAQALGLKTVLVRRGTWAYDHHDIDEPTLQVRCVSDLGMRGMYEQPETSGTKATITFAPDESGETLQGLDPEATRFLITEEILQYLEEEE